MSQSKISSLNKLSDKKFDLEIEKVCQSYGIKYNEQTATIARTLIKYHLSQLHVDTSRKKDIIIFTAVTISAILMLVSIYGLIIGGDKMSDLKGLINYIENELNNANCTLTYKYNMTADFKDCRYSSYSGRVNNECPFKANEFPLWLDSCHEYGNILVGEIVGGIFYSGIQVTIIAIAACLGIRAVNSNQIHKNKTSAEVFRTTFTDTLGSNAFDIYTFRRALAGKKQDEKEVSLLDMPAEILLMIESYLLPQNAEKAISTLFFVDNLMMGPINKIIEKKDNPYFKLLKSIADKFTKTHESDNDHVQIIIEDKEEKKPAIETTSLLQKQSAKTSSKYNSIQ